MAVTITSATAFAQEVTPKVFVDGCEVVFTDQNPIIENDRTLIPIRGVMEAAGADVGYYDSTKKVQIKSHDNWKIVELFIGDTIMKSYKLREDLLNSDLTEYELEVPAKVVNDRTLIPLRAVNDAFGYETTWDDETKTASVTTDRKLPDPEVDPSVYLSTDVSDVAEGDLFDVYVNIKNFTNEEGKAISGGCVGIIYDKSKFSLEEYELCNNSETVPGAISSLNVDFSEDSAKFVSVTIDEDACLKTDGAFYKITFQALSDDGGEISLSKRYNSNIGYDTMPLLLKDSKAQDMTPIMMDIDDTPIVLN